MTRRASDELLLRAFAKFDKVSLGIAVGVTLGLGVFSATALLVLKGGEVVGPNLVLLSNFFFGYRVTWVGAFVGMAYGLFVGFGLGFLMASFRNAFVFAYLAIVRARQERRALQTFLDEM